MADDKKTLRIEVVNDSASQQKPPAESPKTPTTPAQPTAPPSPQGPPSTPPPSGPPSPPTNYLNPNIPAPGQGRPANSPPVPTVGIPNSPPPINPPTPPTGPPAPPTPRIPATLAVPAGTGGIGSAVIAGAAEIIGPAMVVVGVAVAAFGALTTAVTLVSAAFGALAHRLQEYDPGIASASGISEMRRTQGDIQQAHDLSKEMQSFIEKRTTSDLTLQRIETAITQTISPATSKLLDIWEQILEWILILVEIVKKVAEKLSNLNTNAPGAFNALLLAIFGPGVVAMFGGLGQLKVMLMQWLNIQLDDHLSQDANAFQKDILDALDPHRADLMPRVNADENHKAGTPITPRRFGQ